MMATNEAMQQAIQFHEKGELTKAENILQHIININPAHAYAWHLLGILAYQSGKITIAIQHIKKAIIHNPHVALFHSNLGEMHRLLKELPFSLQYGQQAVALDPHSASAWSNLGIAYYDAKNHEEAQVCHQRALAINPQLSCSLNNLGSIFKALNNTKKAMLYYQAAIAAAPNFVDSLNNLAVLLLQEQAFTEAHAYLNRVLVLAPNFAEAHCNMGFTLLGLEQTDNAQVYFEKALSLKSDNAEAYYGFAKIYLLRQHFIEAENSIRKALQIKPDSVEFYQCLSSIYHEQGHSIQALDCLEQAFSVGDAPVNLFLNQGLIWMDMGNLPNAETAFLKATTDQCIATRINAHYSLIQLRKVKPDHPSFHDLLSFTRNIQAIPQAQLAYLYFALGKCYEDMGEWKEAFRFFSEGCRIKRSQIHYDAKKKNSLTQKITQIFTPQMIESLRNHANPSALPIFIVGMPRSGTTLIEQIISSHPDVYGAGELKYWNDLLDSPFKTSQATHYYPDNIVHFSPEICQSIAKKYLSYLKRFSAEAVRITDKMPYNYIAIGVIHALLPNATIIHVKRNPIDTCLSCYTKLFTHGQSYSYDLTELGQYYQSYECIMDHWRKVLPESAWLEIEYEAVVHNLEAEAKRLLAFCGLSWDPACLDFYQTTRAIRTASFAQVRRPVYTSSVERWRSYENELMPLINILNQRGRDNLHFNDIRLEHNG